MSKTWFITGTSKGFGREWAIAALDRGDRVAATARNTSSLDDLVSTYGDAVLPLQLDVTADDAAHRVLDRAVQPVSRARRRTRTALTACPRSPARS